MEPTVRKHVEKDGMLASGPRDGDPQIGLGLGEVEDVRAVAVHRRAGLPCVEPSPVDFGDVRDDVSLGMARIFEKLGQPTQKVRVCNGLERSFICHTWNTGRVFSASQEAQGAQQTQPVPWNLGRRPLRGLAGVIDR
jgi:hypothetical protein